MAYILSSPGSVCVCVGGVGWGGVGMLGRYHVSEHMHFLGICIDVETQTSLLPIYTSALSRDKHDSS